MGKIVWLLIPLFALLQTACFRPTDCSVQPLVAEEIVFNTPVEVDTLAPGETVWFYSGKPQPDLKNQKTIEKSLPYAPHLQVDIYQVGFGVPTDSLVHVVPGYSYTYTTVRPFILKSGNNRSAYSGHTSAVFEGELTKDSVLVSWGLEAKIPGLYLIRLKGRSDILLDHRNEECPVSWRYTFRFPGAQDMSPYASVWPDADRVDKRRHYLVCVKE